MSVFDDIRDWYRAQCNGDWEHDYGVVIQTLDNPGWLVKIDLNGTILQGRLFEPIRKGDSANETDWCHCHVTNEQFVGAGDIEKLEQILQTFIAWAKSLPDWLAVPKVPDEQALRDRDDRDFWADLGTEIGPGRCQHSQCSRSRISQSVFCREHHFEMVKGRPYPFLEEV